MTSFVVTTIKKRYSNKENIFPLSSYSCSSMRHLNCMMLCSSISTLFSLCFFQWSVFSRLLLSAPWWVSWLGPKRASLKSHLQGTIHPKMKLLSNYIFCRTYSLENCYSCGPLPLSLCGKEQLRHSAKHLFLCSTEVHRLGTILKRVNDDRTFIFGWNISFSAQQKVPVLEWNCKPLQPVPNSLLLRITWKMPGMCSTLWPCWAASLTS